MIFTEREPDPDSLPLEPTNKEDMAAFIEFVPVFKTVLLAVLMSQTFPVAIQINLCNCVIKDLVDQSRKLPLVSGFYGIIQSCLMIYDKAVRSRGSVSTGEDSPLVEDLEILHLLRTFLQHSISVAESSSDPELRCAILQMILVISHGGGERSSQFSQLFDPSLMCAAMVQSLRLGRPFAMDVLLRWLHECHDYVISILPSIQTLLRDFGSHEDKETRHKSIRVLGLIGAERHAVVTSHSDVDEHGFETEYSVEVPLLKLGHMPQSLLMSLQGLLSPLCSGSLKSLSPQHRMYACEGLQALIMVILGRMANNISARLNNASWDEAGLSGNVHNEAKIG